MKGHNVAFTGRRLGVAQATFSYRGLRIKAIVDAGEDIDWLVEFLVPWFGISDEPADVEVRVKYDPQRFKQQLRQGPTGATVETFMMDTHVIVLPEWRSPENSLALFDDKHGLFYVVTGTQIELLHRNRNANYRLRLMRVLRELAMGAAQLSGGRFIHASAFAVDGRAAIVAGPREAGKSSVLSYVLANTKAHYLCNDRLLINDFLSSVQARGMPTIVSLREGTTDMIPGMRQRIVEGGFTSTVTLREGNQAGPLKSFPRRRGRHGVTPGQFCAAVDCVPARSAEATVLIFPSRSGAGGKFRFSRLDQTETQSRLKHCLFGNISPQRLSQAFTILPDGFDPVEVTADKTLFSTLAENSTGYDCELGNDAYEDDSGAKHLLRLLNNQGVGR